MPGLTKNKRRDAIEVFTDETAFATTLVTLLIDIYGTEALYWTPEMLRTETEQDFGFSWDDTLFDRLMAGIVLLVTDRFYKSLPDFVELCNILAGEAMQPGVFAPADVSECAWGITEALLLAPPEEDDPEPFTEDIRGYVGEMLKLEGILSPPDILRIGMHDPSMRDRVRYSFSDDPEMFTAIYQVEQGKTDEINGLMKARVATLLDQLEVLPLTNGDAARIAEQMKNKLSAA